VYFYHSFQLLNSKQQGQQLTWGPQRYDSLDGTEIVFFLLPKSGVSSCLDFSRGIDTKLFLSYSFLKHETSLAYCGKLGLSWIGPSLNSALRTPVDE